MFRNGCDAYVILRPPDRAIGDAILKCRNGNASGARQGSALKPADVDQTRRVTAQAMIEMLATAEAAMQRAA